MKRLGLHWASWADPHKVFAIYCEANELRQQGIDCAVDHVIPLNGDGVCGLHVETNLQIVTAQDNAEKGNSLLEIPAIPRKPVVQLELF